MVRVSPQISLLSIKTQLGLPDGLSGESGQHTGISDMDGSRGEMFVWKRRRDDGSGSGTGVSACEKVPSTRQVVLSQGPRHEPGGKSDLPPLLGEQGTVGPRDGGLWKSALGTDLHIPADSTGH